MLRRIQSLKNIFDETNCKNSLPLLENLLLPIFPNFYRDHYLHTTWTDGFTTLSWCPVQKMNVFYMFNLGRVSTGTGSDKNTVIILITILTSWFGGNLFLRRFRTTGTGFNKDAIIILAIIVTSWCGTNLVWWRYKSYSECYGGLLWWALAAITPQEIRFHALSLLNYFIKLIQDHETNDTRCKPKGTVTIEIRFTVLCVQYEPIPG